MSFCNIDNPQDRNVEKGVAVSFRPQLFNVTAGSYGSNAAYGAGVAVSETYEAVTLRNSSNSMCRTNGYYTKNNDMIDFDINVCLDGSAADPATGTLELRVRGLPAAATEPPRYGRGLPAPYQSVIVNNLTIFTFDASTAGTADPGPVSSLPVDSTFSARVLADGQLALIARTVVSTVLLADVALTSAALAGGFGGAAGDAIFIKVHGSYRAAV